MSIRSSSPICRCTRRGLQWAAGVSHIPEAGDHGLALTFFLQLKGPAASLEPRMNPEVKPCTGARSKNCQDLAIVYGPSLLLVIP